MQQPGLPIPPHLTTPPKRSRGLKFVLFGLGGWVLLIALFLAIWQFLAPTDRKVPVPYSTFLDEVHAGRVQEIRVQGRDIDYRLVAPEGSSASPQQLPATRHTTGPVPDQAFLDSLKPTDASKPAPKIFFEQ